MKTGAASDGLDYLPTDHLGSLTLMTFLSGALHSDVAAPYEPCDAFQHASLVN